MAFKAQRVTVTNSATNLLPANETDTTTGVQTFAPSGQSVWITVGATDIWVHGTTDVATDGTKGRKVAAGTDVVIDLERGDTLFGITASGTSVCDVAQVGVV